MSAAGNIISAMWNAASSATSSILDAIYNTVTQIFNNVTSFLSGINLGDIGRNMMQGLLDGISGMAGAIWGKITEIGNGIKDKISGLLSIHSPSRWFRDFIGVNMMKGWINGIDSMKSAVQRTTGEMTEWMKPEMLAVDTGPVSTNLAKSVAPSVYGSSSGRNGNTESTQSNRTLIIENVTVMDGYEVARVTQPYIDDMQTSKIQVKSYMKGGADEYNSRKTRWEKV